MGSNPVIQNDSATFALLNFEKNFVHDEYTTSVKKKEDIQARLDGIMCGVQRVPTLLLFDPTQSLSTLHLEDYTILDCEPLHDLKGHFNHLLQELPYLFKGEDRSVCEDIIRATTSNTMTGA